MHQIAHSTIGSNFSRQASGTKSLVGSNTPYYINNAPTTPTPCHVSQLSKYTLVLVLPRHSVYNEKLWFISSSFGLPHRAAELEPQSVWFNSLYMHRVHTPATQLPVQLVCMTIHSIKHGQHPRQTIEEW